MLSRFYGIVIRIYHREAGPPHFHAIYAQAEDAATVDLETLAVTYGGLPPRALGLVLEWAREHRGELRQAWDAAQAGRLLTPIPGLE